MGTYIRVCVASGNPIKYRAIYKAFKNFYNTVDIIGVDVDPEVSQPLDEEVMIGASNRVKNMRAECKRYDFLVACEGGIICQYGKWFIQQVVLIEDKNKKQSWGLSQAFPIPRKYIEEAKATSIAKVVDKIFMEEGKVKDIIDRRELFVYEGTMMALVGMMLDN